MIKFILLFSILIGCSTTNKCKESITIVSIKCPKNPIDETTCTILFSDNTNFYLPHNLVQYIKIGEVICLDKKE